MAAGEDSARDLINTAFRWFGRNLSKVEKYLRQAEEIIRPHLKAPKISPWDILNCNVQTGYQMISDYRLPELADSESIFNLANLVLAQADRETKKQPMTALSKYESVDRMLMQHIVSHPGAENTDYLVKLRQRAMVGCQTANSYRLMLMEKFKASARMPPSIEELRGMEEDEPWKAIQWYMAFEASLLGQMGKEGIRIIRAEPDMKVEGDISIFERKYLPRLNELGEGRERAEQNQDLLRRRSLEYRQ